MCSDLNRLNPEVCHVRVLCVCPPQPTPTCISVTQRVSPRIQLRKDGAPSKTCGEGLEAGSTRPRLLHAREVCEIGLLGGQEQCQSSRQLISGSDLPKLTPIWKEGGNWMPI